MIESEDIVLVNCRQGTQEWHDARAGVITASEFSTAREVLSKASKNRKAGDPSAAADTYAAKLAIEIISGKHFGEPPKAWMLERGHQLEDEARAIYESRRNVLVEEFGFIHTKDRRFGYSTDGLVDREGMIEVKCPVNGDKIFTMFMEEDLSEYIDQIQGGLWLTNRKWCDFIMYVPELKNAACSLYIQRVFRNENYIEALEADLWKFSQRVSAKVEFFRQKGGL